MSSHLPPSGRPVDRLALELIRLDLPLEASGHSCACAGHCGIACGACFSDED